MKIHRLSIISCLLSAHFASANIEQCDSIDFCGFVNKVETNYAGFSAKVNDKTQSNYNQVKDSLYESVISGSRNGYDAAAEYAAWFNDPHLRVGAITEQYRKPKVNYDSINYNPKFISLPVDEHTFLIRIPTFYDNNIIDLVNNAISSFQQSGRENLIIDIRGNGGGFDYAFGPLIKLIYNRPFYQNGAEFKATTEVAKLLRDAYESQNGQPSWAKAVADSIETGRYDFVPIPMPDKPTTLETINILPKKVALVIDNRVASSAEQFVILAKNCSDRVFVYGKDNTLGALDYTNPMIYELPCSKMSSYIPTSRTTGIENIDNVGIAPDIIIPLSYPSEITDNIDSWIYWIANELQ